MTDSGAPCAKSAKSESGHVAGSPPSSFVALKVVGLPRDGGRSPKVLGPSVSAPRTLAVPAGRAS